MSSGTALHGCLDGRHRVQGMGNWTRDVNKTIYLCVGLITSGHKEVLGMWLGKTVPSLFWMLVLTDLKSHGVEDILITVTDNLNSFTDTIRAVSP